MVKKVLYEQARRNWGDDDSATPILHVDMDAFFVEAELRRQPHLKGKPFIVGGRSSRSVVSSASYQARKFGVRAGMPIGQAIRLCPDAIVVPPQMDYYSQLSKQVMAILSSFTPSLEPISVDEAFLDVGGARRRLGTPIEIAQKIRQTLKSQLQLPSSVGIAKIKLVAKIASGQAKPDGVLLIPASQTVAFLHSLPIAAMWGIGQATQYKLQKYGIETIQDLAEYSPTRLGQILGKVNGIKLQQLAQGIDRRRVEEQKTDKSVGTETTFSQDIKDFEVLHAVLLDQSYQCAARLRAHNWIAGNVTIKLRTPDFHTWTRSRTLMQPSNLGREIAQIAQELFQKEQIPASGLRLLGVTCKNLSDVAQGQQLSFDHNPKNIAAEKTLDQIHQRFPGVSVQPAALLRKCSSLRPKASTDHD